MPKCPLRVLRCLRTIFPSSGIPEDCDTIKGERVSETRKRDRHTESILNGFALVEELGVKLGGLGLLVIELGSQLLNLCFPTHHTYNIKLGLQKEKQQRRFCKGCP